MTNFRLLELKLWELGLLLRIIMDTTSSLAVAKLFWRLFFCTQGWNSVRSSPTWLLVDNHSRSTSSLWMKCVVSFIYLFTHLNKFRYRKQIFILFEQTSVLLWFVFNFRNSVVRLNICSKTRMSNTLAGGKTSISKVEFIL